VALPEPGSLKRTVRQALPSVVGLTHASRVRRVTSSALESGTVTQALVPLKDSALPNLPDVDQVVFEFVPVLLLPDRSETVVPEPSSKL
jgi:hypothetical protein